MGASIFFSDEDFAKTIQMKRNFYSDDDVGNMELSLHLSEDETDEFHPIVEDISKQQPDDINPCGESISCKMKDKNMIKKNLKRPYQDLEDPEIVINEKYFRKNQDNSTKILALTSSSTQPLEKTVTSTTTATLGSQHIAELIFDLINNLDLK